MAVSVAVCEMFSYKKFSCRGEAARCLAKSLKIIENDVEFYLYPTVGTVLIHSVKPELTE